MKNFDKKNEFTSSDIETEDVSSIYYSPPYGLQISQFIQEKMLMNELSYQLIDRRKLNYFYSISYDYLTGLPTKKFIIELLEEAIQLAKKKDQILVIFYLHINNYKQVINANGHAISNKTLVVIAKSFRKLVLSGRQLSRFGEDEFLISLMIKKSELSSIDDFKKAISLSISEPIVVEGRLINLEINVEEVAYPIHGDKIGVLIDIAKHKNDKSNILNY